MTENGEADRDQPAGAETIRVPPEVASAVLGRVRSGSYRDADEVLTRAMQLMTWAEGNPIGQRQLLKFAVDADIADAKAGRRVPGEEVVAHRRARTRENGE